MSTPRPNILLVCSDQHTPRVAGCYGNKVIATPNIDRLAREGCRFDAAYCNSPICVSSRHSFLTGLYPFETGSLDNGSMLNPQIPTYAHMAVMGGYHTVLAGRMHLLGPNQSPGFLERLTGDVQDYEFGSGSTRPDARLGNMSRPDPLRRTGAGENSYIDFDRQVTRDACDWLHDRAGNTDQPFLMTVGYWNPHCPYLVPEKYYQKYAGRVAMPQISPEVLDRQHPVHREYRAKIEYDTIPEADRVAAKAAYFGLVDFLDEQIGGLLETLEQTGLLENTIVVYFSDHGEMMGEHGRWHKGCFYEDSVRVPLIVRMPEKQGSGTVLTQPVSLIDLFPTVCDWIGVTPPHKVSGNSLLPLLEGETNAWSGVVKAEYYEGDSRRMIRRGNWKLSVCSRFEEVDLYDLSTDPEEIRNRADDPGCEQILAELRQELYSDGWNEQVLADRDRQLTRFGYWQWKSQFGKSPALQEFLKERP